MSVQPPTGFSFHNITVIFGTATSINMNSMFNSSSQSFTSRINTPGTYNVTVYEKNFNTQIVSNITVNPSKL